ncbi:MAG: VWA domain-containing protein, partial [Planctomycetales bacterium]|nr:VWA domain-containing protein [Planctomycetales bacterium]
PEPSDSPAAARTAANAGLASPAASPSELEALASSPALPSDLPGAAAGAGLPGLVASGGGRSPILPGLGDAEILAGDPLLNRQPTNLGPTATIKVFGAAATGRSFVFLIDRSKSMGGDGLGAIEAAERELLAVMDGLSPAQQFQIIAYNQTLSATSSECVAATDSAKEQARKFLRGIVAFGQTEHKKGLFAALRAKPDVVYIFTDGGEPGLHDGDLNAVMLGTQGKTAICAIQFGFGPRQEADHFLQRLAARSGGQYVYLDMSASGGRGNFPSR